MPDPSPSPPEPWLNRTVLGIGLTSLASDWSHEMATAILPALLLSFGAGAGWLGAMEGAADGLSSFLKLGAGHWTDRLRRRKPLIVSAYAITTLATGSIAFASSAYQVLIARCTAWAGRGVRTPAKKALLASSVPASAYGRAFGLERMMDTLGAILGPLSAVWLLSATGHNYRRVFLWTLVPGLAASVCFALLVRERPATPSPRVSFLTGLRNLSPDFRTLLVAVGVFGLGDFSHTLLILYATRTLAPKVGLATASAMAIGLYLVHNVFYAGSAYAGGWLSDRVRHRKMVLAAGYALATTMIAMLIWGGHDRWALAIAFALAGTFVGVVEALEDSLAAQYVAPQQHGMAFGAMAAVNAVGDFGSSILIGTLWSFYSPAAGFAVAGVLFLAGIVLVLRLREPQRQNDNTSA